MMAPYGRRLTLALIVALVVVVLSGGGLAYLAGHHRGVAGKGIAAAHTEPPDAAVADTVDGQPTDVAATTGTDALSPVGPVNVALSPSAENAPDARDVADLVARYFSAINRRDYDAWLTTVTTAQALRDRDSWNIDYSTTRDSDVYISDIMPGHPLTLRMQFVSRQALEFAPTDFPAECVRWDVTYQVLDEGVGLRVGTSAKKPAMASC
ncbi:MAG: hypothetical protein ABI382_07230 [Nakamurella sp.]